MTARSDYMRGQRHGAIVHGVHDMGTEVPLYDFSGMHDMAGLGVDLGQEVALYDYSGIGVDLGNPLSMASDYVQNLTAGLTTTQKVIGVLGVLAGLGLVTGAVKAKTLNPLTMLGIGGAKKKRNPRRRRSRRNGMHTSARRNRSTARRRRRNPARRRRSRR